jgi:hypothetical protein
VGEEITSGVAEEIRAVRTGQLKYGYHMVGHRQHPSLWLKAGRLDPAPQDQQSGELVCGKGEGLAHGRLAAEAVRLVVVASASAIERAVDRNGPRLHLLVGDHLGTPTA